ncbi:MAG: hypothetical protein GY851_07395 [bacterium]|nr:hypothetical protein [bacterium]
MAEGQTKSVNWGKTCAIGCLVLVVLGVVGVIAAVYLVKAGMDKAGKAVAAEVVAEYDSVKADGKVPEEHAALFDGIVDKLRGQDATLWSAILVAGAVADTFSDGEVDEDELKMATAVDEFLEANPEPGMMGLGQFMEDHPELQGEIQSMQQKLQPQ